MRKIKVVVLLVRQLQHGFTKNAKVSPNLTVTHILKSRLQQNPSDWFQAVKQRFHLPIYDLFS